MQLGSIRYWVLALVFAALAAVAPDLGNYGRASAQVATAPADATPRGGNSRTNTSPIRGNAEQQDQEQQPITFFSGRVIADDGSQLGESAAVATVCNGGQRIEAYTDSKGWFSFQFGDRNLGVFQDASVPDSSRFPGHSAVPGQTTPRRWELATCELEARVPGFLSESVRLSADEPNVGTIIVHRLGTVEGKTVSAASLAAPKDARKAFEKGKDDLGKNKLEDARKNFEKAVELYPDYAAAWQELGKLQYAAQQNEEARRSFETAIKADPKFLEPYLGLTAVQAHDKDWHAVLETTDRTLKLDPYDYPQAYYLSAVANFNLNNPDAAEKNAREAEKLDPHGRFPGIRRLLSTILLSRHDYTAAADQMRGYLKFAPESATSDEVRTELSKIENESADRQRDPEK